MNVRYFLFSLIPLLEDQSDQHPQAFSSGQPTTPHRGPRHGLTIGCAEHLRRSSNGSHHASREFCTDRDLDRVGAISNGLTASLDLRGGLDLADLDDALTCATTNVAVAADAALAGTGNTPTGATQLLRTTTDNLGNLGNLGRGATEAVPGIKTPYGVADQGTDAGSIVLRGQVETGGTVYRQGVTGTQQTADGQFWAGQNPASTPGYANSYGTPGTQVAQDEYLWIMGGTVEPGTPFVTRGAPGIGTNLGGAPEVVVNPGGVRNLWFHMPD